MSRRRYIYQFYIGQVHGAYMDMVEEPCHGEEKNEEAACGARAAGVGTAWMVGQRRAVGGEEEDIRGDFTFFGGEMR